MDNNINVKELQEERTKLYYDFYQNIIPKRLPVWMTLSHPIIANYAKQKFIEVQYDFKKIENVAVELCEKIYSDRCPFPGVSGTSRLVSYYSLLDSNAFKMSADGFMQHPEVHSMNPDEYDEFISDPYAFMLEKALPRLYKNLDPINRPYESMLSLMMAENSKADDRNSLAPLIAKLNDKFGYTTGGPAGCSGTTEAPYDFLADLLRSFTGISTDLRRNKQKVKDACEALYPIVFKLGMPSNPHFTGCVNIPVHMPPYMRPSDMEEVYMPTVKKMAENYASIGVRLGLFFEGNCMQHLDLLQDMPCNLEYRFEYGDPQKVKDVLGNKFIVGGMYPIQLLDSGTKEQVLDKAKELLDIMMPGGGYLFSFDKGTNAHNTINMDNMNELALFIRDYAIYSNAGQSFGKPLNSEGFVRNLNDVLNIKTKYSFDWEEYKKINPYAPDISKDRIKKYYDNMLIYIVRMFM